MGFARNEELSSSSFTEHLAGNLLHLMKKKQVTDSSLARSLGLPYNTIKRITSGETTDPKISTLTLIADFFNVGIDELLGTSNAANGHANSQKNPSSVPILSWTELDKTKSIEKINANNWENWQPVALPSQQKLSTNSFAIGSRKSMQPRFPLGTMFIIDPKETPVDGDVVLMKINSTGELALRELVIDPPVWQLLAINDNHSPITYNADEYEIKGVVVFTVLHSR